MYFFRKEQPPPKDNKQQCLQLAKKLAPIGLSLPKYVEAYERDDDEGNVFP